MIRTVVGFVGVLLPLVLILGEAFFIRGGVHVRGSLSAYYHTSMRDVFVSSLCVAGIMLATYMSEKRNADFWLSLRPRRRAPDGRPARTRPRPTRSEVAATRALANAARMVAEHPGLLQLRTLQAVGAGGATVVLTADRTAGPADR